MQRSKAGEVGVEYWLKWQVPVCGMIMVIPAAVAIKLIIQSTMNRTSSNHHHQQGVKMEELWKPCWRKLNPRWLLVYRAATFVIMAWLLSEMIAFAGFFAFFFYTQWTFTLVMVYFGVGTFISAKGCFMSSDKEHTKTAANKRPLKNGVEANGSSSLQNQNAGGDGDQGAGFLGSLLHIIYHTAAGASILTDLVFWVILMPMLSKTPHFQLTLVIACIHSLNAVFLIIDSLLNALPFQWFGFNYFIIWTVTYAAFQWVSHACCTSWWPYPFLELSTPWAPLWYLGIALIHVPCYALYVVLVKAKNSIFSKLFPQAFVRSHGAASQHCKAG